MNAEEKLEAVRRVLERELLLSNTPVSDENARNMDYISGRQAAKSWADDVAHKALAIIRSK